MSWRAAAPAGWCLGFGGSNAAFQAEGNGSLCGEGGGLGKTHLSPTGCSQSFVCCDWGFLCITDRQEWVWVVKQLHLQTEAKFASETLKSKSSWLLILFSLYSGGNLYPVMKLFLSLCHRYRTLAIC